MLGEYHIIGLDVDVLTYAEFKKVRNEFLESSSASTSHCSFYLTFCFALFQGRLLVNYTVEANDEDVEEEELVTFSGQKTHTCYIRLDTPWKDFQTLDLKGWLDIEDSTYKTNVTLFTDESYFTASGNLEVSVVLSPS